MCITAVKEIALTVNIPLRQTRISSQLLRKYKNGRDHFAN